MIIFVVVTLTVIVFLFSFFYLFSFSFNLISFLSLISCLYIYFFSGINEIKIKGMIIRRLIEYILFYLVFLCIVVSYYVLHLFICLLRIVFVMNLMFSKLLKLFSLNLLLLQHLQLILIYL